MKLDFKGKNILITGASGGIGKSVANEFYKLGGNIIGTSTTKSFKKKRFELIKRRYNRMSRLCISAYCETKQAERVFAILRIHKLKKLL